MSEESKIMWFPTKTTKPKADMKVALLLASSFGDIGNKWPDTYEIIFGKTYYEIRRGSKEMYITSNFIGNTPLTDAIAWARAADFERPDFLPRK